MSAAVKTERTWVFVLFMLYHLLNASILFIQPVYDWFDDEYSLTGLICTAHALSLGFDNDTRGDFILVRSLLEIPGRQFTRWFDPSYLVA